MANKMAAEHLSCKCPSHRELWKKIGIATVLELDIIKAEIVITGLNIVYMLFLIPISWYSSLVMMIIALNTGFNAGFEPMWFKTTTFLEQIAPWWKILTFCGMVVLQEVVVATLQKTVIFSGVGQPDLTGRMLLKINLMKCIVALSGRSWALSYRNREAWRFLCRFGQVTSVAAECDATTKKISG